MNDGRVFSFLKNVFLFLINRLYKECVYMCGNGHSYSEEASERGDLYAKPLIEKLIHDRARKYDKYMVDGISVISCGTISVVPGEAHLTGLSTLHRSNICYLTEVGNRVLINGTFRAGPLAYQREIVFKFSEFQRKTSVLVSLMDIKVSVDFSIEKETGRNGFLLNFAVNELKGFNLRVNGLGYFDWTINLVLSFFTLVLGRIVRNLLENELEQYILSRLPKYQFPVEGTSYRNETKFNVSPEDVHQNEPLLSETPCMKQSCEMPKWSRVSPIAKKCICDLGKRHNSIEYGTVKELGYNLEIMKTYNSFLQIDNRATEVNSFCMPEQSLGLCSESECENSCTEVSKDKSEDNCDRFSALSSDSISNLKNSSPQGITSKNRLEDACPLSDWNIPNELNDISETESSRENTVPVTSSTAKGAKNVSFFYESWENAEKESKMEDSSQTLRDSCRHLVEMASEDLKENTGQSERLHDIFSENHEDEVNEKIPLKHAEGYIGEDALNEDSLNKADEGCTSNSPRNSEQLNTSNFQNDEIKRNNLPEKLTSFLNDYDSECPNGTVEFSSIDGLKSNSDSLINSLETPDRKALHDLQIEIITKIQKLKSSVLLESEENRFMQKILQKKQLGSVFPSRRRCPQFVHIGKFNRIRY